MRNDYQKTLSRHTYRRLIVKLNLISDGCRETSKNCNETFLDISDSWKVLRMVCKEQNIKFRDFPVNFLREGIV